jgi:hypothetical protein
VTGVQTCALPIWFLSDGIRFGFFDEDLINRLKSSKKGLDIEQQDLLNEVLTEKEISDEAYDMSDMGEDYHNYYMGEEDDRDEFDDEDS